MAAYEQDWKHWNPLVQGGIPPIVEALRNLEQRGLKPISNKAAWELLKFGTDVQVVEFLTVLTREES